ncbi:Gm29394 [Phodopus roborovskii]|uniref:Gm29394 protein n=1 Tax=Phodopus roborovskii TaxID=109678 RepID=A0AAV0A0Q8_PHORO|nr:Gm29394 [Phodopus roborovskii]
MITWLWILIMLLNILKENKFFNSRCLNYCEWAQSLADTEMLWGIHTLKTGSNVQKRRSLLCQSETATVGEFCDVNRTLVQKDL